MWKLRRISQSIGIEKLSSSSFSSSSTSTDRIRREKWERGNYYYIFPSIHSRSKKQMENRVIYFQTFLASAAPRRWVKLANGKAETREGGIYRIVERLVHTQQKMHRETYRPSPSSPAFCHSRTEFNWQNPIYRRIYQNKVLSMQNPRALSAKGYEEEENKVCASKRESCQCLLRVSVCLSVCVRACVRASIFLRK
jgi:hypothetical protein